MAVTVNKAAFEYAKTLILEGQFVYDERGDWSEHQPSTQDENEFIRQHGIGEYARWHLGVDREKPKEAKTAYGFPFGDFKKFTGAGSYQRKLERRNTSTRMSQTL